MSDSDKYNLFSDAQTTTTGTGSASTPGVRSTNIILKDALTDKWGAGTPIAIEVLIATALTSSGSNDAMNVSLYHDTDSAWGSATLAQLIGVFPAVAAAGTRIVFVIPPTLSLKPYLGLYYLSQTTDAFTAGAVTAMLKPLSGIDGYTSYPIGYAVG